MNGIEGGRRTLAQTLREKALSKFESIVSRIGEKGAVFDEQLTPVATAEAYLALAPITPPKDGAAQTLYAIAYDPSQVQHPLRETAQTLFNYRGDIPAGIIKEQESINGVISLKKDGSMVSKPIKQLFAKQKAVDIWSRRKPTIGSASPFKALRVVRT